jgi:class 3 adenylate cyclase/pimeloyl-ACP methyl ester carboxylesterase
MDKPQIRYCTAADGVSIAYYVIGEGPPVVSMGPVPFRHIELQWELEPHDDQQVSEILTQRGRRYVQFDPRGLGSSSETEDFSLDAFVSDLEAVAGELGDEPFDLVAVTYSCPIAVAYAARHPERVSHLALDRPFVLGAEALDTTTGRAVRALRGQPWDVYADTALHVIFRGNRTVAEYTATLMREAASPDVVKRIYEAVDEFDVTDALAYVRAPTLVLSSLNDPLISPIQSRQVAARIPGARIDTNDDVLPLIRIGRFLGILGDEQSSALRPSPSSIAVILFTDIVSSTELTERMGDTAFRNASRVLDAALRAAIRDTGGSAIAGKLLGDGVLAIFPSAAQAIEGARRCLALSAASELGLHIGLHAGDVIREDDDVFGGAVNIASRICGLSAPGEILVSDVVRGMGRSSAGVTFEDRGDQEIKGIGEPVRLYAVRW